METKSENKKPRGKSIKVEVPTTPLTPNEIAKADQLARRVGLPLWNMFNAKQN